MPDLSRNKKRLSLNSRLPTWLKIIGYLSRNFMFIRFIKLFLYRLTGFDFNKYIHQKSYVDTVKIINGLTITLYLNDQVDRNIWWDGYYEKIPTGLFQMIVKQGDIVVDIGANIGYYSLLASSKAKKVFSFEPVSKIYERLSHNVGSHNNIKTFKLACGNQNKTDYIYVSDEFCTAGSRLTAPMENQSIVKEEIGIVRLDDFLERGGGYRCRKN